MGYLKQYTFLIKLLVWVLFISLFFNGSFTFITLAYIYVFLYMIAKVWTSHVTVNKRIALTSLYIIVLIMQLFFNSTVTYDINSSITSFYFNKLFSVLFILVPFYLDGIITMRQITSFYLPSVKELSVITFTELKINKDRITSSINTLKRTKNAFKVENVVEILKDFTRNNNFRYINNDSLTEEYFNLAYNTLSDPYIYIVISDTGSPMSEIVSAFTQKQYNHASISFDYDLKTIISYNGGERVYPPGLNSEMITYFNKKADSSILVYKLKVTKDQKKLIIDKVKEINREGSAYNVMGLLMQYSPKPNIMFCSQFVYKMLQYAGVAYFNKKDEDVRPTDFVELDYHRKLEFAYEMLLNDNAE